MPVQPCWQWFPEDPQREPTFVPATSGSVRSYTTAVDRHWPGRGGGADRRTRPEFHVGQVTRSKRHWWPEAKAAGSERAQWRLDCAALLPGKNGVALLRRHSPGQKSRTIREGILPLVRCRRCATHAPIALHLLRSGRSSLP